MKVAVIIDTWFPLVGGGQINAWEISKRLAKKGIEIHIITRNNGPFNLRLLPNLKINQLGKKTDPLSIVSKILFLIRLFFFLYKNDYDLIHAHAFFPGITARLIMVIKGTPAIFTVHGTSIGTKLNNKLLTAAESFILTKIKYSAQITVSRDFFEIKNVNKKIFYISNGVDLSIFNRVLSKKSSRPRIIFVGRLHPQKNVINLVKSIKYIKDDFPNIQLLIIGEGPQEKDLKKIINEENLNRNIKILGKMLGEKLIKLYKSSSLFTLPSIYEGQSLSLLEAFAAKIPVIVTKTGDNIFIVKSGVNGFFFDNPLNPEKIAFNIEYALNKKNLNQLGRNGFNYVKSTFSWENTATKTLAVYEQITNATR